MFSALDIGLGAEVGVDACFLASVQVRLHLVLAISLDALLDILVGHWATRSLLEVVNANMETGNLGAQPC